MEGTATASAIAARLSTNGPTGSSGGSSPKGGRAASLDAGAAVMGAPVVESCRTCSAPGLGGALATAMGKLGVRSTSEKDGLCTCGHGGVWGGAFTARGTGGGGGHSPRGEAGDAARRLSLSGDAPVPSMGLGLPPLHPSEGTSPLAKSAEYLVGNTPHTPHTPHTPLIRLPVLYPSRNHNPQYPLGDRELPDLLSPREADVVGE